MIDSIELLKKLIKIKSDNPGHYEYEIAHFISNLFHKHNIDHEIIYSGDRRANIIGYLHGKDEDSIIFSGHLDTKPPNKNWTYDPYTPVIKDNKVYGLGAADMKGGLAAIIAALIKNSKRKLNKTIYFIFTADEEMNSTFGMKYLAKHGYVKGAFAIVAEPTNLKLATSSMGNIWFKVTVKGKTSHAGMYWKGINAIDVCMEIIREMKKVIKNRKYAQYPMFPNLNVGTIKGGTHPGIVPSDCEFTIDIRFLKREDQEYFEKKLKEIAKEVSRKYGCECAVTYFGGGGLPPWDIKDLNKSYVLKYLRIIEESYMVVFKKPLEKTVFLGGSDAGILMSLLKIPTVIIGPGSLEQAHSPDEYVHIDEVIMATKLYSEIMRRC